MLKQARGHSRSAPTCRMEGGVTHVFHIMHNNKRGNDKHSLGRQIRADLLSPLGSWTDLCQSPGLQVRWRPARIAHGCQAPCRCGW